MSTACQDLAPLVAALPLGILDEGERASALAHIAVCESCPKLQSDVEQTLELTVPQVSPRPVEAEKTWLALEARLAGARAQRETASDLAVRISLSCSYCHGGLTRDEAAFCAGCLAPHHEDCFSAHGRCSAPGCEEQRIVRPGMARAPERRWGQSRRLRDIFTLVLPTLTGGAVVAALSVAGMSYLASSPRSGRPRPTPTSQPVAQVEAPPEATLPPGLEALAAQRLLEEGVALSARAEWELAMQVFELCVQKDPSLVLAWTNLASAQLAAGRPQDALQSCERAIVLTPDSPSVYESRAQARLGLADVKGAIEDLRHALYLNPRKARTWAKLGSARAEARDAVGWQAAIDDYARAIELNPLLVEGWLGKSEAEKALGKTQQALDSLNKAVEVAQPRGGDLYRARGTIYLDQGALELAETDLSRAIEADPKDAESLAQRAQARLERGRLAESLVDMAKALELDPARGPAAEVWFEAFTSGTKNQRALERAVARHNRGPWLLYAYGRSQYRNGPHTSKLDNAAASFRDALERDPGHVPARLHLGKTLYKQEKLEAAIAELSRVVQLDPRRVEAWTLRGRAHVAKGQVARAIPDFRQALELAPSTAALRADLGKAYQAQGKFDAALNEFTRIIELDPSYVVAYTLRGRCYEELAMQAGDAAPERGRQLREQALVDYGFAIDLHPNHAQAWLRSGMLKRELGADSAAQEELKTYLRLAPGDHDQAAAVRAILAAEAAEAADKEKRAFGRSGGVIKKQDMDAAKQRAQRVLEVLTQLRRGDRVQVVLNGGPARSFRFQNWSGDSVTLSPQVPNVEKFAGELKVSVSAIDSIRPAMGLVGNTFRTRTFEITRPSVAWTFDDKVGNPNVLLRLRPTDPTLADRVAVTVEVVDFPKSGAGVGDLMNAFEEWAVRKWRGFQRIRKQRMIVPDPAVPNPGRPGLLLLFTSNSPDLFASRTPDGRIQGTLYGLFGLERKRAYAVTCYAAHDLAADFEEVFAAVNESFKVVDAPTRFEEKRKTEK